MKTLGLVMHATRELSIKLRITFYTYSIWLCLVSVSILILHMHTLGHRVEVEAETCS